MTKRERKYLTRKKITNMSFKVGAILMEKTLIDESNKNIEYIFQKDRPDPIKRLNPQDIAGIEVKPFTSEELI